MHPRDFREYWGLKNGELAQLYGMTVDGVNSWFRSEGAATVPTAILSRTSELHARFLSWEAEEDYLPPDLREVFENVRKRRQKN